MNKYLVVRLKSDWAHRHVLRRILERAIDLVPFKPDRIHYYRLGDVLVFAAESDAAGCFERQDHVHFQDPEVLLYDGAPLLTDIPRHGSWVKALRAHVASTSMTGAYDQIPGTYNLVHVEPDRFTALSDFSGCSPLFYLDDADVCAVSNRQLLLARVARRQDNISFNYLSLSWLTGQSNIMGDDSIFAGVRLLNPGTYLCSTAQRTRITDLPKVWEGERRPPTPLDYDTMTDSLLEQATRISSLPFKRLTMPLTGGKDSRLVLALAMRSGLVDSVDEIFTNGRDGSPEIEIAGHIARAAGVPHTPRVAKPSQFDIGRAWDRLKYHLFRFEGSVCPWDGCGDPATRSELELYGWGGEVLSRNVKAHSKLTLTGLEDALPVFADYQQPTDPLGVQRADITAAQREAMRHATEDWHRRGNDLDELTDILYLQNRMPYWAGILTANIYAKVRLFPLFRIDVARAAFRGGPEHRKSCRIHFEILRRLDKRLAELPFLGDAWDPRLAPYLDRAGIRAAPPFSPKKQLTSRNLVAWQWDFLDCGWQDIRALLLDHPQSGIFDIADRARVEAVMRDRAAVVTVVQAKEIFSLIAMQLLFTGQFTVRNEGPTVKPALETNIGNLTTTAARERYRVGTEVPDDYDPPITSFRVPADGLQRLRLDPTDQQGTFILGQVWITLGERTIVVSDDGVSGLLPNRQIANRRKTSRATLYEALGTDPSFTLALDFDELIVDGLDHLTVHARTASSLGGRAVVYYDCGDGLSESQKVTAPAPYLGCDVGR